MSDTTTQDPTLTRDHTEALILAIIRQVLHCHLWAPAPHVTLETGLDNDVDRQSIAHRVEEEILHVELPERVWRAWLTVGDVVDTVRSVEHG